MLHRSIPFDCIWFVVSAVTRSPGEAPCPGVVGALDRRDGRVLQVGMPKLGGKRRPPYPTGPQALIVTVDAQDLAGLHIALGWRMPERIIDLMVEFRNIANGQRSTVGLGLVGAMVWFGLPSSVVLSSGNAPEGIRRRLHALEALFDRMAAAIDWGRALLRGRYLLAVARMEATGVPIDRPALNLLDAQWMDLIPQLIRLIDADFCVYRGGRFDRAAFAALLAQRNIDWPRTQDNILDLSDDVFSERARAHPELRPLKELRSTLTAFRPDDVAVGRDGRNRTQLRPFASRTGRNQPRNKSWILGGPAWVRNLIQPKPGHGVAVIDWSQQEFGIAAALSGDTRMQAAYRSRDPYLAFAASAGAVTGAECSTVLSDLRDRYKSCAIGVLYGMGAGTLARRSGLPQSAAEKLLTEHKAAFPTFWRWTHQIQDSGLLTGGLQSVLGWRVTVDATANPRFLRNYAMQANGAEMLRLACCLTTEAGIRVCAPLHDALLIEAPISELGDAVGMTREYMAEASSIVLDDFALRTDVRTVTHPQRLGDRRGAAVWKAIEILLGDAVSPEAHHPFSKPAVHQRNTTCTATNTRPILYSNTTRNGADHDN